jgi:hypothetical protein
VAENQTGRRKEEGGEVYEKSLEMKHFRAFSCPEEAELAPCWAAGVGRDEKMKEKGSHGSGWMYNQCWPKMDILA